MRGKSKKPLLLILIIQLAILSCAFGGTYAKYTTSLTGTASARVAKFDISTLVSEGQENDFSFSTDDTTATYSFTVMSDSEVAVEYDVVIICSETLPNSISLTLDGKSPIVNGTTYTFETVGTFTAEGGENTHTLTIRIENFEYRVNQNGIVVQVVARQVA